MNIQLISAFAKSIKKKKNGTNEQIGKLVVKTDNSSNYDGVIVNPIILQQTGHTGNGKITVR